MRIWINPTDVARHHESNLDKSEQIYRDIDSHSFDWQIWAVAASGFFTDSYNLFATNVILPSLAYIYWPDDDQSTNETSINAITLAGSIVGQLCFGYLADRYGRRKMYGLELIVVIVGTLGISQCSAGYNGSMSIVKWILFWRFVVGTGIGAEYPLSAVITAEFAPRLSRGRMMAAVFLMQPVGQLAASLVGLILLLTYGRSNGLETMTDKVQAATIIDTIWRWVVGVGAIPAVIAIIFRLTIPESPRYTLDVDNDGARALRDTRDYYNIGDMDTHYSTTYDMEEVGNGNGTGNGITPVPPAAHRPKPGETDTHSMEIIEMESHNRSEQNSDIDPYETDAGDATDDKPDPFSWNELKQYFWVERNIKYLLGTSICWFILDFAFYGLGINNPRTIAHIWASEPQATLSGGVLSWANPSEPELSIYEVLKQDGIRSIITVSVGSLIGSVILIKVINYVPRRSWLVWSFIGMAVLFAVIGGIFFKVVDTELHALIITLYILCQILFNLGPNTLTFIIPAEIFPTRYRATCHGIAAASGKLGSVIVQAFLGKIHINDPNSTSLGWLLIAFAPLMALGALVAWAWIPEVQWPREVPGDENANEKRGRGRQMCGRYEVPNKSLEELARGMAEEDGMVGFRFRTRKAFKRAAGRRGE